MSQHSQGRDSQLEHRQSGEFTSPSSRLVHLLAEKAASTLPLSFIRFIDKLQAAMRRVSIATGPLGGNEAPRNLTDTDLTFIIHLMRGRR